jgi:signal transduction histidine kinase
MQKNDSVLWYARKALDLSMKINYIKGEFESRKWVPIVFRNEGDYPTALKAAFENLDIAEQTKDTNILLIGLMGVASTYREMNDFVNQLKYNRKCKELIHSGYFKQENELKSNSLFYYLTPMAVAFQHLNRTDSALYYLHIAYNTSLDLHSDETLAITGGALGNLYYKAKLNDSAMYYFKQSLYYTKKTGTRDDLGAAAQLGIGHILAQQNQFDSAIYYATLALNMIHNQKYPATELEAAAFLNKLYEREKRMDSAYKYLKLWVALKDSLFNQSKIKQIEEVKYGEALKRQQIEQERKEAEQQYKSKVKVYSLIAGVGVLFIIAFILYRNNRQKHRVNIVLNKKNGEVENALKELKATQAQLIQSEKMASLGELTAGIAHEIQNPLNFVNNFSEVSTELVYEMEEALKKDERKEAVLIASDIKQNLEKIINHGKRADAIVKGMLQHSRVSTGHKEPTDINALADEYLRLSYHGLRAKDKDFNATLQTDFDESLGRINVVPQDIGRALLNLFNNAFYVVNEKKKQAGEAYEPKVVVSTKRLKDRIEIIIKDNGNGIPEKVVDKIFQPFFTTKPTGQGTGLGLSLSYDIVKAHGGEIKVETKEGEGARFIILLPLS